MRIQHTASQHTSRKHRAKRRRDEGGRHHWKKKDWDEILGCRYHSIISELGISSTYKMENKELVVCVCV